MPEENNKQSWWQTLPGIFTAIATIITAITGFTIALNQSGCFHKNNNPIVQTEQKSEAKTTTPVSQPAKTDTITAAQPADTLAADTQTASQPAVLPGGDINLLSLENGGQLITAGSDKWSETNDDKEDWVQLDYGIGQQAVYGFKDGRTATFQSFAMLINGQEDANIKQFELFAGNGSPTGPFTSLGKFTTQNMKLIKYPYQKFSFNPVTAKYLKFKLISTYGWPQPIAYEFKLWGKLN